VRAITKGICVGFVLLAALSSSACLPTDLSAEQGPPPAFTVFRRQALYNGHGIVLSVLAAKIEPLEIERLAAKERRSLVRILVYTPDQTVSKDRPAEFWELTDTQGLRQIY
jgi:hypothetical protein